MNIDPHHNQSGWVEVDLDRLKLHGDTPYPVGAPFRTFYLAMLASHVVLSMVLPFLAMVVLWFAFRGRFDRHRKIARVTLPIWLYVSVTGVLVFAVLRVKLAYG